MTAPLVPRVFADLGVNDTASVVLDSDASLLEAVVEAAREMREQGTMCEVIGFDGPTPNCKCESCETIRAFDAAVAKLEGKP